MTTDGKLAGINTGDLVAHRRQSIGIGFAIPANLARRVVEGASSGGVQAALDRRGRPGGDRRHRREPRPVAAGRRVAERHLSRRSGGAGGIEDRRRRAVGRRRRRSTTCSRSITASPRTSRATSCRRRSSTDGHVARRVASSWPCRRETRARNRHHRRAQSAHRRAGGEPFAGRGRRSSDGPDGQGRGDPRGVGRTRRAAATASSRATSCARSTARPIDQRGPVAACCSTRPAAIGTSSSTAAGSG